MPRSVADGKPASTRDDACEFTYQSNGHKRKPPKLDFLLPGMILFGKLTGLEGDMKAGKSTFLGAVAADLTGGHRLPGFRKARSPTPVLYYCREEVHDEGVCVRVKALGGDPNLILWPRAKDGLGVADVAFPGHCEELEKVIKREGARLVVIDQLDSFVDGRYNLNLGQPCRAVFDPIIDVAMRTGAAIILVRQLNKDASLPSIHRGAGSTGWGAACASVLAVSRLPGKKDWRAVSRVCGRFGGDPPPLAFESVVAGDVAIPLWHPEYKLATTELDAGQMDAGQRDEDDEATNLLKAYLKDEWVTYETLKGACLRFGCTERTLRRRKAEVGVIHRKASGNGKHWSEWHSPKGGWPK
jgi:AAA domain